MPAGTHREIYLGAARTATEIDEAIREGRKAPAARLTLPPAPAGASAVGVDPGKRGGLIYFAPGGVLAGKLAMPLRHDESVDTVLIEAWLRRRAPSRVYLELVHAHPNDGKSRIWAFASHMGALKDAIARAGAPCTEVDPQRWQNVMLIGLPRGTKTKQSARKRCAELWPTENFVQKGGRVPHDGVCDAALIGAWGLYFSGVRVAGEMPRGGKDLL